MSCQFWCIWTVLCTIPKIPLLAFISVLYSELACCMYQSLLYRRPCANTVPAGKKSKIHGTLVIIQFCGPDFTTIGGSVSLFQCITEAKLVTPTSTKKWHTLYEFQPSYGPNMSVTGEMCRKYSAHIWHKNSSFQDISPKTAT
jgi:hypothetical protein